jgi:LysR family transcriptional regulator for bpeEF and oprC
VRPKSPFSRHSIILAEPAATERACRADDIIAPFRPAVFRFRELPMDRLHAMRVFTQVVEAGSFSRAAQALDLPAPSVSRLVQSLEAHLSARLLNRTTRSVTVTDDGLAYYDRCLRVLGEIDDMEADLGRSRRAVGGRVRISLPSSIARGIFIPALPAFLADYPDIRLDLSISDRPVDLVKEGIDCAIRVGEVALDGVVGKRAGKVQRLVCASPSYLARHGEPTTPAGLRQHVAVNYMSQATGRILPWEFVLDGAPHRVQPKGTLTVNDADAYVECGVNGLGIVHASTYLLLHHLKAGTLVPILTGYQAEPRVVHVIHMPNRHLPRKTRVFIDWFCDVFRRHEAAFREATAEAAVN